MDGGEKKEMRERRRGAQWEKEREKKKKGKGNTEMGRSGRPTRSVTRFLNRASLRFSNDGDHRHHPQTTVCNPRFITHLNFNPIESPRRWVEATIFLGLPWLSSHYLTNPMNGGFHDHLDWVPLVTSFKYHISDRPSDVERRRTVDAPFTVLWEISGDFIDICPFPGVESGMKIPPLVFSYLLVKFGNFWN